MILKLDTVQGTVLDSMVKIGRYTRMGLVTNISLPLAVPTNDVLVRALAISGLPQKGDRLIPGLAPYDKYFLKRHIVRPIDAATCVIEMWYDYNGLLGVRDSSSLSSVPTQINPVSKQPLYVHYQVPGGKLIKKLATLVSPLPMRQLVFSQTVDYMASPDVLDCLGCVNNETWQGLPIGYWLCSGMDATTDDEGITYTYTVTFTTKIKESWSQFAFMTDDTGQAVFVAESDVTAMKLQGYIAGEQRDTVGDGTGDLVNGLLKVGMFETRDFFYVFGV